MTGYDLLPSVAKELPWKPNIDPLHNEYVNYLTFKQISEEISCIPSKLYVVSDGSNRSNKMVTLLSCLDADHASSSVRYTFRAVGRGNNNKPGIQFPSSGVIDDMARALQWIRSQKQEQILIQEIIYPGYLLFSPDSSGDASSLIGKISVGARDFVSLLNLLYEIKKLQPVTVQELDISGIRNCAPLDQMISGTLTLSTNITQLKITCSTLAASVWEYLAQQLHGCDKLEDIDLQDTKDIPAQFCKALSTASSLRKVNFKDCNMTSDVIHALLSSLCHCKHLQEVHLGTNTLTDCTGELLGPSNGFPKIE